MSSIHVMAKPSSSKCNIDCEYCFYLEKEKLYPDASDFRMSDEVLEAYISQTISQQKGKKHYEFSWQGGEPTLLGLDFFKKALQLQRNLAGSTPCVNSLQTNGILLNTEWAEFLAKHRFLVGVSIDGNQQHHDTYRKTRTGKGTHERVLKAINLLKRHKVEFNAMVVVHQANVHDPLGVYNALKSYGIHHIQLTPLVERQAREIPDDNLILVSPAYSAAADVARWSVGAKEYGQFLCDLFDAWKARDFGKIFIYNFESTLTMKAGLPGNSCITAETCGNAVALESNGDVYSCDHFVYPEHKLGNIMAEPLAELAESQQLKTFGLNKKSDRSVDCNDCRFLSICNGGCPKHRFLISSDGQRNKNYLCDAYKMYFSHTEKFMDFVLSKLN
ncbi:anaerobic sulfatase maturase [Endozoicomonas sp. OPT23]|uniref:anaerobic sulfatase maturase n=1 Tax=Endozoicomonas sp. OPT23 TaxID=2072845 RepID=UPI00129AD273|nr:anaerobic sulfatase maturase [Endozoicomonas sp. OPT23]MRI32594.1 anaerobic sulfatase maturase [Endozoicomonas sp. OPT23]